MKKTKAKRKQRDKTEAKWRGRMKTEDREKKKRLKQN